MESKQNTAGHSNEMDSIARGVEARLDPFSAYAKTVTQRTIDIARQLGIAEQEIQMWAASKSMLLSGKDRVLKP